MRGRLKRLLTAWRGALALAALALLAITVQHAVEAWRCLAEQEQAEADAELQRAGLAAAAAGGSVGAIAIGSWTLSARRAARARRRLETTIEHQRVLAQLGRRAVEGAPMEEMLSAAVELAAAALDAPIATIFELCDHETLQLRGAVGWPGSPDAPPIAIAPDSQAAFVARSQSGLVVVEDYRDERRFTPAALLSSRGIRSTLAARIGSRAEPYGIMSVHSVQAHRFGIEDESFLEELAHILSSVIDRRRHAERLTHQALHDPLTMVANRRHFAEQLASAPEGCALLLIDVDHFKEVNDSYGHAAGDAILQAVARRLVTLAGPHDTVARLGGDEFALLAAGPLDGRHAAELGHRLVDRITQPIEHDGGRMHVSVSVGVAHAVERSLLTRNADVALYAAKRAGRSRSVLFDATRHEALAHRVELRDRLASAVAANRLEVAYQPIMHLGSGRIRGFEALVRWTDEVLGPVRPDVFIALAEDSGLIGDLGRAVLAKACRQLAVWRDRFPALDLQMSVNLSPRQLEDEQLVDHVRAILRDNHLDASSLTLEVTESAFTAQDRGVEALNRLHAIGVGLALDDFGSSESSLARLHELPVTALKIDRSFLTQLAVAPERTRRLIEAVVAIAAALELPTVAEGIETTDQWAAVEGAGCDYGQGFIIARPMDLDAAEAFLSLAEVDRSDGPLHALFD